MPIPPYVADLRTRVGTDLLWLPGVTVVVRDDAGRVLLTRRADNDMWALVSGIIDPGEEPALAAARESLEETGVAVLVDDLAAVSTTGEITYPNGDRTTYLDLLFTARPVSAQAAAAAYVADDENTDVGWFALDALPEPLTASTTQRLALLRRFEENADRATVFVAP